MGILDQNQQTAQQPNPIMAANNLKNQAYSTYKNMVDTFNNGAKLFWSNPRGLSPQQISDALGSDARELFELHGKLGTLISSIKPEDIAEGISLVGQFTYNEDGTVTINSSNNT